MCCTQPYFFSIFKAQQNFTFVTCLLMEYLKLGTNNQDRSLFSCRYFSTPVMVLMPKKAFTQPDHKLLGGNET